MYNLREYQENMVNFAIGNYEFGVKGVAWWASMGAGKTLASLHLIKQLREEQMIRRALIVAPLSVCLSVWPQEARRFGFGKVSVIHGTPKNREQALRANAPMYAINYEGLPWLAEFISETQYRHLWDLIIFDESSRLKNHKLKTAKKRRTRFAFAKALVPSIKYRLQLTGTPMPKGLEDVWSQMYLLDEGQSLGPTITGFRRQYMTQVGEKMHGKFIANEGSMDEVVDKVHPFVLRVDVEDHLDMPDIVDIRHDVILDDKSTKAYKTLEADFILELMEQEHPKQWLATHGGAAYSYLRQFCSGYMYEQVLDEFDEAVGRNVVRAHDHKVKAVVETWQDLGVNQLLLFVPFTSSRDALLEAFAKYDKDLVVKYIDGSVKASDRPRIIDDWNASKINVLICHPAATSHGLNMQLSNCSDVGWFGLTDSLEIFEQANARVRRQGHKGKFVRHHYWLVPQSIEEVMHKRIVMKSEAQCDLLDSLKNYAKHLNL